jgi:hypothetical protein
MTTEEIYSIDSQSSNVHLDKYADVVDSVLMAIFIVFVLFFACAWKTCPLVFHGIMRRIMPEMYFMDIKRKQVHAIKNRFSSEYKNIVKGLQFPGLVGLAAILAKIVPPDVKLPANFNVEMNLGDMLKQLNVWLDAVQLPMINIPNMSKKLKFVRNCNGFYIEDPIATYNIHYNFQF